MPFSGWRRSLLRAFTGVALYLGLWLAELMILQVFFNRPRITVLYLPGQPLIVNFLIYLAIPSIPLAVVGWFYKGRRRDRIMVAAAFLFAALVWIPWLGTYSAPISVDVLTEKAVSNGYEICGIYRATTEWNTFVYSDTLSKTKRCMFILLRPEPRFNYGLRINQTTEIKLLHSVRENSYTFYPSNFIATQFYLIPANRLLDFQSPSQYAIPLKHGNHYIENRITPERLYADDMLYWFTFSPEPGSAVVEITVTVRMRAEAR
jgi:hypothetical protein